MSSNSLTVLMSVYNAEKYLPAAIESVLAQSHSDFRFVVVDDGSTDDCPNILDRYAHIDNRLAVLPKANGGLAAALNYGLSYLDSAYVARMDADDIAMPERFSRQVAFLDASPDVAAVGSRVLCIDESGRVRRQRPVVTGSANIAAALPHRNCISHPSAMIRTSALVEVGGYREKFRLSQDYDLWLRLSERHSLQNIGDVLLHYRTYAGRSSALRNRSRQTAYSVAAAADFFSRKYGLPTSDEAIDIAEPVSVTTALETLLAFDVASTDRKALLRHSLRLVRHSPGNTVRDFGARMLYSLAKRREYESLAKLMIYKASGMLEKLGV